MTPGETSRQNVHSEQRTHESFDTHELSNGESLSKPHSYELTRLSVTIIDRLSSAFDPVPASR